MDINLERIKNLFGNSTIQEIQENQESFLKNIEFLEFLGCPITEELVELYPYSFLKEPENFKKEVQEFLDPLGVNSFEKLEEDTSLWEVLDE